MPKYSDAYPDDDLDSVSTNSYDEELSDPQREWDVEEIVAETSVNQPVQNEETGKCLTYLPRCLMYYVTRLPREMLLE